MSYELRTTSSKFRILAFEVTKQCKFNCRHCRAYSPLSGKDELTTAQCKEILSSVAKYSKNCMIIFTGGEPLERGDIYELIEHAKNLRLIPVIASCGYPINKDSVKSLKEAGIKALSLSLDGATAEIHNSFRQTDGAFEAVCNAAKNARLSGLRFQINTTITKSNINQIGAIAEFSRDLGAYCFNPFILVPTGRGEEITAEILEPQTYEKLLKKLLELKEKSLMLIRVTCGPQFARLCKQKGLSIDTNGCMGGREFGFINSSGDVQICGFLDVPAGNLVSKNYDFAKIWTESEFLKKIRSREAFKGNCGMCKYMNVCGGCRARAYSLTGDYLAADPICNYHPLKNT